MGLGFRGLGVCFDGVLRGFGLLVAFVVPFFGVTL